jgi:hypothetical protein
MTQTIAQALARSLIELLEKYGLRKKSLLMLQMRGQISMQ